MTLSLSELSVAGPALEQIGWVLLHSLWQGALVALLLAGALRLLRSRGAGLRYALSVAALVGLLALPVMTWTLVPEATTAPQAEANGAVSLYQPALVIQTDSADPSGSLWTEWRSAVTPYVPWLAVGWGLGVLILGLRLLGGWVYTRRLRQMGTPVPERWQLRADALAERLNIRQTVAILQSARIESPMVVGWWKPVVLIPLGVLTQLPPDQVEALLTHELVHIRRHDVIVGWLQAIAETLLFYHPAAWWISWQVRTEREHCCDDLVVAAGTDRLAYARALTELVGTQPARSAVFAPAAQEGDLLARIRRLLKAPTADAGWWHRMPLTVVAALIVAVPLGFAACASQQATTSGEARAEEPESPAMVESTAPEEPTRPEGPIRAGQVSPASPDTNHKKIEAEIVRFTDSKGANIEQSIRVHQRDTTRSVIVITPSDTVHIQGNSVINGEGWRFQLHPDSMEEGFRFKLGDRIIHPDSLELGMAPPPAFFEDLPEPPRALFYRSPNPPALYFDPKGAHPDTIPLPEAPHPPVIKLDSLFGNWAPDAEQRRKWEAWAERWSEQADEWELQSGRWEEYVERLRQRADSLHQHEAWESLRQDEMWREYAERAQQHADSLRKKMGSLRTFMERRPEDLRQLAERLRRQAEELEEQASELEREAEQDSSKTGNQR